MGVEFASSLALDENGRIALLAPPGSERARPLSLRRDLAATG
jgi:hypothetical protein